MTGRIDGQIEHASGRSADGLDHGVGGADLGGPAAGALEAEPDLSDEELREVLSSNLCRCTGYQNIFKAVRRAADEMRTCRSASL